MRRFAAIDSVHWVIDGVKRYFINAIDIKSRFSFCQSYDRLNSQNAKDFFLKLKQVSPFDIKRVQTDNGLEFYCHFDDVLKQNKILHFWNYPRSHKSNAFIERFDKTLRQQFLNE